MSKICECGKAIKGDFDQCYMCSKQKAENEGRMCACGKFKKAEFENCYACSQANKGKGNGLKYRQD